MQKNPIMHIPLAIDMYYSYSIFLLKFLLILNLDKKYVKTPNMINTIVPFNINA